ncbi:MAG: hypothetical protein U0289_00865 [Cyclobacteriaceae bacterium]|jgi:hypothetical protein|nr:hypothetical protein [Cytophagales bacterium]HNP75598.1 hypothetical protein [Cyclobacteriaceae bacterium]HQQ83316.1 hypothetical protein [Cyclobacteriaceae bacterium]
MKFSHGCATLAILFGLGTPTQAQFLNKLKQKAESKLENAVDKKVDQKLDQALGTGGNQNQGNSNNGNSNGTGGNNSNSGGNNNGGGLSQNQGGGLITTPPDVKSNLADAESAYKAGKYGDSRYSLQQAMLGVELEIGNKILKSLPESISGLNKDASADQVTSTGFGWAGLTIQRKFTNNNGKDLEVTVANNAAWMSAVNMYMNAGGYAQQTGGQQNWKQVKVKGNRAIIEFSQGSGYKLSVPIGQSSLIVYEAVNFANENEVMTAANAIDIDGIKKMLGEQ